jgi:hypothetical protein
MRKGAPATIPPVALPLYGPTVADSGQLLATEALEKQRRPSISAILVLA